MSTKTRHLPFSMEKGVVGGHKGKKAVNFFKKYRGLFEKFQELY